MPNNISVQDAIDLLNEKGYKVQQNGAAEPEKTTLIEPTVSIAHEDLPNGRWYHLEGDDNINNWKPSATTYLSVIRLGAGFDAWNQNLGHTASKSRNALAQQGTEVHYWMVPLIYGDTVDVDQIKTHILGSGDDSWKWLYKTVNQYAYQIRRYLASFCQFWVEHNPIPVACEYPIYHKDLPFGGRLDLIVSMKKAKNSKKRSNVLLDLKTGNSYASHTLQNSAYKVGWELLNPEIPIDYIGGLYVSNTYRDEPKYTLKYQNFDYEGFLHAAKLWHRENSNTKGVLKPTVKKAPPTEFNLYNKKETE